MDLVNWTIEKIKAPGFIKSLVDHNRGLFVGMAIAAAATISVVGCSVKTTSPISGQKVNREQLDAEAQVAVRDFNAKKAALDVEAENLKSKLGPAYGDLDRKEAAANTIIGLVNDMITKYVPSPWSGVAATGLGAMVLGLGYDNRRKDGIINNKGA
jgi:hypothetical protein